MRVKRRFESVEELEKHLRSIHEPFGNLTDSQWRHLAEHSAVKTEEIRVFTMFAFLERSSIAGILLPFSK